MKIGITTGGYIDGLGVEKGFKKMREHGYQSLDFQTFMNTENELYQMDEADWKKYLLFVRQNADDNNIEISQTHGPWRCPIHDYTDEERSERFEKMSRAIVGTRLLGCKSFVIHNIMPFGNDDTDYEKAIEMNREYFTRLLRVAIDNDVVICLENMPFGRQALAKPQDMLNFVKSFNSPNMRMCLDTGHAACLGISPAKAVRQIGKEYLRVMHVHDTEPLRDRHWLPGDGVIDWVDFANALKEINFEGTVSLETCARDDDPTELERKQLDLVNRVRKIAE